MIALFILLAVITWLAYKSLRRPSRSSLHFLSSPPNAELILGNLRDILNCDPSGALHDQWRREYGNVFFHRGVLRAKRLCLFDRRALTHILVGESANYPKPDSVRQALGRLLGPGVLFAEGDAHKKQRKILNPAFGPIHIRALTPIFIEKAIKTHTLLLSKLKMEAETNGVVVDMFEVLSRTSLDIICAAGFGYETNSLDESSSNELVKAVTVMFDSVQGPSFLTTASMAFPIFSHIPDWSKRGLSTQASIDTINQIGHQLLANKKKNVRMDSGMFDEEFEKHQMTGKDILSLLVKANMAADLKDSQKLTDEEVVGQITTFLISGIETASTTLSWTLHALCKNPSIQTNLRKEIRDRLPGTIIPSMEDLNTLPYLDAVVRESLRIYTPLTGTARIAAKDDVIPLSKPFTDTKGIVHRELHVPKGTCIWIPISGLNRDEEFWGDDSRDFKPERWLLPNLPEGIRELPSMHLPSFLAGSRACIGYKFAITEMKAILVTLLRDIAFDWSEPSLEIGMKTNIIARPFVKSRPEEGNQLPLRLRIVRD